MSEKTFKLSIALLSVLGVIVLAAGIAFSAVPTGLKTDENPVSAPSEPTEEQIYTPIVDTKTAETFDSVIDKINKLKNRYPDLIKFYTAGYSEGGNEIFMYTLGKGEKKALITGAIHAREHITTKYILKVTEDYCRAYESPSGHLGNYNIYELLNEYTVYVIPVINPDGLKIIQGELNPERNVRVSKLSEYKANKNGVDLNRNFPLAWEHINNKVYAPADYYFKGYTPASEKETQILMDLCNTNNFDFLISFHVKGNVIFWGDTYNTQMNSVYKGFAQDIAYACDFSLPLPTMRSTDYGGGFENWFRHTYSRPGICIELVKNQNTILPLSNANYIDFNSFVNYEKTVYALCAALDSSNK